MKKQYPLRWKSQELAEAVYRNADAEKMSVNDYIQRVLKRSVGRKRLA